MSKVNTSKTMANVELSQADLERQIKDAAIILREEKKVKVSIPKALQKSIGLTLPLGINGAMIVLPVDGSEHEVPAPYKALLNDYLANLTT
jgi:hypothetical protein